MLDVFWISGVPSKSIQYPRHESYLPLCSEAVLTAHGDFCVVVFFPRHFVTLHLRLCFKYCPALVSHFGVKKHGCMDSFSFPPFVPPDLVAFLCCHILRSAATWDAVPVSFYVSPLCSFCHSHSWVGSRISAARVVWMDLAHTAVSVKSDLMHFLKMFSLHTTNNFIYFIRLLLFLFVHYFYSFFWAL